MTINDGFPMRNKVRQTGYIDSCQSITGMLMDPYGVART
jgi:hypothetical protein